MKPALIHAWAAEREGARLSRVEKPVPALKPYEILLEVIACGICHSDLHLIDNDWHMSTYPLVPGHEILGRVVERGSSASLEIGSVVGVGWQRGSCLECDDCISLRENTCDTSLATCVDHWGGYADYHVSDSRFCFPMPKGAQKPEYAPLLCGGATVFSPLHQFVQPIGRQNPRVGIVALGGLGHIAVKFAKAMGAEVTLFSSNDSKEAEAKAFGVDHFVNSTTEEGITSVGRSLDLVLVTANVDLPWEAYLKTLRTDGTLCFVGVPPSPMRFDIARLLSKRLRIAGSPIAGRHEIRRMLEFAARHEIGAQIETFPMEKVNEALEKVRGNQARYRAVLIR